MRASILVALLAVAAFGATLAGPFHFDDYSLFRNPAVVDPDGWRDLFRSDQIRPFTYLTFWANYQLGGRNPIGYHLVNPGASPRGGSSCTPGRAAAHEAAGGPDCGRAVCGSSAAHATCRVCVCAKHAPDDRFLPLITGGLVARPSLARNTVLRWSAAR